MLKKTNCAPTVVYRDDEECGVMFFVGVSLCVGVCSKWMCVQKRCTLV